MVVVATTIDTGALAESTHCFAVLQPRSCRLDWAAPLQGISAIASSMLGPKPTVFWNPPLPTLIVKTSTFFDA